jgi:hypothetical protein
VENKMKINNQFPDIIFNPQSENKISKIKSNKRLENSKIIDNSNKLFENENIETLNKSGSELIFPECAKYFDGDIEKHFNCNSESCFKQFYKNGCYGSCRVEPSGYEQEPSL